MVQKAAAFLPPVKGKLQIVIAQDSMRPSFFIVA